MKIIAKYVDQMAEELEDAKEYAECYLENKMNNNTSWANKYKEMAGQELTHSLNTHDRAVEEINKLRAIYTPPEDMLEKWEKSHREWIEKSAWIKQMLTM